MRFSTWLVLRKSGIAMRIPTRGSRIFAEWPLPAATSDVAATELGGFRGRRSYKDCAPTELGWFHGWRNYKDFASTDLVGECLVDQNAELTATADIIADTATNSLK